MPQFLKKPMVIEAWQWNGERQGDMRGVCQCRDNSMPHLHTAHDNSFGHGQVVFLSEGDWIIPESKPERFYPCKADVFAKTYELAELPLVIIPDGSFSEEDMRQPGYITYSPVSDADDPVILRAKITQLEQQLEAEGEHTAAANANIDRLNTEIERITRRQQGILAEEQSRKH